MKTVPAAVAAWAESPGDFQFAVETVVLSGGDTDTTAAIVGGLVGARVGEEGVPRDWLSGVRDWPRGVPYFRRLAAALADGDAGALPKANPAAVLVRNAAFAGIVLTHGFRHLLPPY